MEKKVGYNYNILINNVDIKTDFNKDINKVVYYQKKFPVTPPGSIREQVHKQHI